MSGHSKWSTIKRKKEATDKARGKLFSKLSRAISIAAKTGGGTNPETNNKLRVAIDEAKAANMPKANIEKALSKGSQDADLAEFLYEGFGPSGVAIMVQGATDNKNRAGAEIKAIFERGGGHLAGPGAVSFKFKPKSLIVVEKEKFPEKQILEIIELGVDDVEETQDAIEVYAAQGDFAKIKEQLVKKGFRVIKAQLVQQPVSLQSVNDVDEAKKILKFLENLEDNEDVSQVFANVDIPDEILEKIS